MTERYAAKGRFIGVSSLSSELTELTELETYFKEGIIMGIQTSSDAEDRFIDKFGQLFEAYGRYPRIAGRIFAYLMICDPPCQSAEQLVSRLRIAKSSVSSMVRLLLQGDAIERVHRPGVRSQCYQIRETGLEKTFLTRLHALTAGRGLLTEGLALLKGRPTTVRRRIEALDKWFGFFENEVPLLAKRWEDYKRRQT